jgi:hypothetical protein
MTYIISLTLETNNPDEAVTGMKELLAAQAQNYGDITGFSVKEQPVEQIRMEGFR